MTQTTLWVRPDGPDAYRWWTPGDYWRTPGGQGDLAGLLRALGDARPVLVVPAERLWLREVSIDAAERRLLRQTLPYQLEDELVDEVDTLHFAWSAPVADRVGVAVVQRAWLRAVSEPLLQAERSWAAIWPEPLLLALPEAGWSLGLSKMRWVLRDGPWSGFGAEPALAASLLTALIGASAEAPRRVEWHGDAEQARAVAALLPDAWRAGFAQAPPGTPGASPLDMAQGDFAPRIPWRRWWQDWRPAAALLVVAVALQFAVTGLDYQRQAAANLSLRQAIETSFREAVPEGAMVEPERQLRRRLDALRGTADAGFVELLASVGRLLAANAEVRLETLNYDQSRRELRLTVNAERFAEVETLRMALNQAGLSAELTGSNSAGTRTRARLRVRDQRTGLAG